MQYVYSRYKTEETFNVVAWLKGTQQQQHGRVAQDFYGGAVFKIIIIIIIIKKLISRTLYEIELNEYY